MVSAGDPAAMTVGQALCVASRMLFNAAEMGIMASGRGGGVRGSTSIRQSLKLVSSGGATVAGKPIVCIRLVSRAGRWHGDLGMTERATWDWGTDRLFIAPHGKKIWPSPLCPEYSFMRTVLVSTGTDLSHFICSTAWEPGAGEWLV